jgi:hypothetical protein
MEAVARRGARPCARAFFDIAITLNTYSHAIRTMEAEAAEKVAALVAGG